MINISTILPENKEEAINYLVKSAIDDADLSLWLERSKKEYIKIKLDVIKHLVLDSGISANSDEYPKWLHPSNIDQISAEVERQVIELVLEIE